MTPRIPPTDPDDREPRTEELLRSLRFDPEGDDLNLFATLAHHPRLLTRWSQFGGLLLAGGVLPPRDREVLILRTAANCGADYEWGHHVEIGLGCGLSREEIDELASIDGGDVDHLLVCAADELHASSVISDETWAQLAERYDPAQLIELCMVVGQYHLVAFTLRSLGIEPEAGVEGLPR